MKKFSVGFRQPGKYGAVVTFTVKAEEPKRAMALARGLAAKAGLSNFSSVDSIHSAPLDMDFASLEERVLAYMASPEGKVLSPTSRFTECPVDWWRAPCTVESLSDQAKAALLKVVEDQKSQGEGTGNRAARWEDGHGWLNLYRRADGGVQVGGMYASKAMAQGVADCHGKGYRNVPTLLSWDKHASGPDKGRFMPEEPQYATAKEARDAFFAEGACAAPPMHWWELNDAQRGRFKVSIRGIGLSTMDHKMRVSITGDAEYVSVSFSSSRWEQIGEMFRSSLTASGVPYSRSGVSITRFRFSDLVRLFPGAL